MKEEIAAAVFFVARLVKRYGALDSEGRERFAAALTSVLFENYKNHWHPNAPTKGQAYRSVGPGVLAAAKCWFTGEGLVASSGLVNIVQCSSPETSCTMGAVHVAPIVGALPVCF